MLKAKLRSEYVQEHLLRRNMSQAKLARRLGVSTGYMSQLMTGQRMPGPVLRLRLMNEFSVGFDTLFEITKRDASMNGSHANGMGRVG